MTKPSKKVVPQKSDRKKKLEKLEAKQAKEAAAQKLAAEEEAKRLKVQEDLAKWAKEAALVLEEHKRQKLLARLGKTPPTPERLKAMARHLHKCVYGTDGVTNQDIHPLIKVAEALSEEHRQKFKELFDELEKETHG